MGCWDRESNFQAAHFDERDQKWWCTGGEASWKGPDTELKKKFPEFSEPTFEANGFNYEVERLDERTAVIRPLGRVAIVE